MEGPRTGVRVATAEPANPSRGRDRPVSTVAATVVGTTAATAPVYSADVEAGTSVSLQDTSPGPSTVMRAAIIAPIKCRFDDIPQSGGNAPSLGLHQPPRRSVRTPECLGVTMRRQRSTSRALGCSGMPDAHRCGNARDHFDIAP